MGQEPPAALDKQLVLAGQPTRSEVVKETHKALGVYLLTFSISKNDKSILHDKCAASFGLVKIQ